MPLDLTPLEDAAAKVGLPGLKARAVDPDPRTGRLFRWTGGELLVSDRLLERAGPAEGQALLANAVLCGRARRRALLRLGGASAVVAGLLLVGLQASPWMPWLLGLWGLGLLVALPVTWARATLQGDDDTVQHLGQAEVLVRALNLMNQDRLELAGRQVDARPDLHRRAERLADKHQLRLPPERRSVPVLGDARSCGPGWDADGGVQGAGDGP